MPNYTIEEIRNIITPIARKYGVKSVSLFGSFSKGTASEQSDIDLKIEKGQLRTLFQVCDFRLAVEDVLKIPVDVITSEASDWGFLERIAKDEVLLYSDS